MHPRAAVYVTDAATMQGSAVAKRDAVKYRGNDGHHHPGLTFVPASVETYAYMGKVSVRYLNTLSEVAAARGPAVIKRSFLAGAHRELRVAFIKFKGPCIVVVPTSWQGLRAVRCHQG